MTSCASTGREEPDSLVDLNSSLTHVGDLDVETGLSSDKDISNKNYQPEIQDKPISSNNNEKVAPSGTNKGGCCPRPNFVNTLLYSSHFLSAWGDRMWQFATGMFLIALSPDSLRLTAIYGFASGGSILLFGAIVGDAVDRYPRLKVFRTSLFIQNFSVCLSATVVCLVVYFDKEIPPIWDGWLLTICHILIILFAVVADVASVGRVVAIERDWIVIICKDTTKLTHMSSMLRRIDLTTNILAPIATGQVITFGSMFVGGLFLAGWNLVSVFVEYGLLYTVYKSVPELAVKQVQPDSTSQTDETTPLLNKDESKLKVKDENRDDDSVESTNGWCCSLLFNSIFILIRGWKTYVSQEIFWAGVGLSCLYMTVLGFDNITSGYAKAEGLSEAFIGVLMGLGALTGILGTFLFPVCRKKFGLKITGILASFIQTSCLIVCVVSIWLPGSPFDLGYLQEERSNCLPQPNTSTPIPILGEMYSKVSHHETDVVVEKILPRLMLSDSFLYVDINERIPLCTSAEQNVFHGSRALVLEDDNTTKWVPERNNSEISSTSVPSENASNSLISVLALMVGIVISRTGLWMFDLTVTQLLLEGPPEGQRGVVNGVQNSINKLMDIVKFLLVIVLPWPEVFGLQIIISFSFIAFSGCFFALYIKRDTAKHKI